MEPHEKISQTEAARRLGVAQVKINEWCKPGSGLVKLADHPWVSAGEFAALEEIARRRSGGEKMQAIRNEMAFIEGFGRGKGDEMDYSNLAYVTVPIGLSLSAAIAAAEAMGVKVREVVMAPTGKQVLFMTGSPEVRLAAERDLPAAFTRTMDSGGAGCTCGPAHLPCTCGGRAFQAAQEKTPISDAREVAYLERQRQLDSLTTEPGVGGLKAGVLDPYDELATRIDEIQTQFWQRRGIRLSQGEAVKKAFELDPSLFARLQRAAREKSMARARLLHPRAGWSKGR